MNDLHPRFEDQIELERTMTSRGVTRYRNMLAEATAKGNETGMPPVFHLLKRSIEPVAAGITQFLEEASKRRGPKHVCYGPLSSVAPEVSALIGCRIILDSISSQSRAEAKITRVIGRAIEDELRFAKFAEEHPKYFAALGRNVTEHNAHRRKVFIHSMNKMHVEWEAWPTTTCVHVGAAILSLFRDRTSMIERVVTSRGAKTKYNVVARPELMELLDDKNARSELLTPQYLPMVIPPQPWTDMYQGGYFTPGRRLPMVKGRGTHANTLEEIRNSFDDMGEMVSALNSIQNTAWKINKPILAVLQTLWEQGNDVAGLPRRDDWGMPARVVPQDLKKEDMTEYQIEQFKTWAQKASNVHRKNRKAESKRIQTAKSLAVAEEFADEPEIYFPHQVDFRSRAYPVPLFLTPQGDDRQKGMLTLAHGKTLDGVAAGWLAIHGANVWGEDKIALEDRITWVEEHSAAIRDVAADPLRFTWWHDADKPFQFLAFCVEWVGYLNDPENFVSCLPVALDGSCNGLQHYAAALRDERGGAAVNLVPSDVPADIYGRVADVAITILQRHTESITETFGDLTDEERLASEWLKWGINRKTTKRSVMIVPYSGTLHACRKYLYEYIEERLEEEERKGEIFCPFPDRIKEAADFLGGVVWEAIHEEVKLAREGMDWLSKAARSVAKLGIPVSWTSPVGFPVVQLYRDYTDQLIITRFGDRIAYTLRVDGDNIAPSRHAQAVAPNFTHANDAAHMYLSVNKAMEHGVTQFAMIHDSYGTVAADTEVLFQSLRAAFVEMYEEHDVFAEFKAAMDEVLDEPLPAPPAKGNLDLMQVMESDFFFA